MKNLARHIDLLLHNNECVILPGFGGFIAQSVPAYYVEEEHLFYPPSRSISFNAAITMNDGLLAQSYMKSYQVDYARATYMIDVAIENLRDILDEEGEVTLPRIGTFKQDIHHSLQFTPEQASLASPQYFGLSTFFMKELSMLQQSSQQPKPLITKTKKTIDVHINKEKLRQVLSTAAVLLLLFMISLPTGNQKPTDVASLQLPKTGHLQQMFEAPAAVKVTDVTTDKTTGTPVEATDEMTTEIFAEVADTIAALPTATATEAEVKVETSAITPIEEVATQEPQSEKPITEAPQAIVASTKVYHIIVASLPSLRGAEETLNKYISKGHTGASLVERDNRVRISLIQFTDKDEANSYLAELRTQAGFESAWLLAVRN